MRCRIEFDLHNVDAASAGSSSDSGLTSKSISRTWNGKSPDLPHRSYPRRCCQTRASTGSVRRYRATCTGYLHPSGAVSAICSAPEKVAPELVPTNIPSFCASSSRTLNCVVTIDRHHGIDLLHRQSLPRRISGNEIRRPSLHQMRPESWDASGRYRRHCAPVPLPLARIGELSGSQTTILSVRTFFPHATRFETPPSVPLVPNPVTQ